MSTTAETVFDAVSESLKPSFASSLDPALVKQVSDAFAVFESPENGAVDVREVGTIIRSLGCCPSEAELQQLVTAMEGNSTDHFVSLEKFVPVVCGILQQKRVLNKFGRSWIRRELVRRLETRSHSLATNKSILDTNLRFRAAFLTCFPPRQDQPFQSASEDLLVRAFRTLDTTRKGYLTRAELETALTGSGEPFSADEMEEMWTAIRSLEQSSRPGTAPTALPPPHPIHVPPPAPLNDLDEDGADVNADGNPIEFQETVDYVSYTKFMMK